jgi:hypothetical protein
MLSDPFDPFNKNKVFGDMKSVDLENNIFEIKKYQERENKILKQEK